MPTRPAAQNLISTATIERQILVLRGHRVMLDRDLAEIYGVKLKRLKRAGEAQSGPIPR